MNFIQPGYYHDATYAINQAKSASEWWKDLEGKHQNTASSYHLIDNKWANTSELINLLNEYFVSVGGDRSVYRKPATYPLRLEPTSIGEVKQLLKHFNTKKATNSENFPTWI